MPFAGENKKKTKPPLHLYRCDKTVPSPFLIKSGYRRQQIFLFFDALKCPMELIYISMKSLNHCLLRNNKMIETPFFDF